MTKTWYTPSGLEITGTLEALTGRAHISGISDDGTPEHSGGTEVFLEDGKTVERDGKLVFLDEDGGDGPSISSPQNRPRMRKKPRSTMKPTTRTKTNDAGR